MTVLSGMGTRMMVTHAMNFMMNIDAWTMEYYLITEPLSL